MIFVMLVTNIMTFLENSKLDKCYRIALYLGVAFSFNPIIIENNLAFGIGMLSIGIASLMTD